MEEKTGGRRLAVDPNQGKKRAALIAVGVVFALLVSGYAALCAYAGGGGGRMAPNLRVGGVEVGGLSAEEAVSALNAALGQRLASLEVPFRCGESSYTVPGREFSYDAEGTIREVSPAAVPVPLRGFRFLAGMLDWDGVPVALTLDHVPEEVNRCVREQESAEVQTTWKVRETAVVFTKGRVGRTVDAAGLLGELTERAGRLLNDGGSGEYVPVEAVVTVSTPAEPDFEAIRRRVYTEMSEAYLDRETLEIVPSVTGKDLDTKKAREALDQAADGQVLRVKLTVTEPKVSTEELNERLFRDVLGEATTRVTGTADRRMNVGVAAKLVDGTILFPGDEFSFNRTCSPYAVSNGYGKATAYVNGLSKDTVAGGICQASSTLYWATLMANLETVERYAHRYEPSYIRGGLDATVFGDYGDADSLDFRFKNSTAHPIKIEAAVDGKNYILVTIRGTDTTGIHGQPYSTNRVVTQPFATIYQANESVPQGTTKKDEERTGYNGVSIETYQKLVDEEGKTVSETLLYKTKYYVRNEVIFFNPADFELWGIDPVTGLRREPAPEESAGAAPSVGQEVTGPGTSGVPEGGESPLPPPEVGPAPLLPPDQAVTPPPAETQRPSLLPVIPPPGTITVG